MGLSVEKYLSNPCLKKVGSFLLCLEMLDFQRSHIKERGEGRIL